MRLADTSLKTDAPAVPSRRLAIPGAVLSVVVIAAIGFAAERTGFYLALHPRPWSGRLTTIIPFVSLLGGLWVHASIRTPARRGRLIGQSITIVGILGAQITRLGSGPIVTAAAVCSLAVAAVGVWLLFKSTRRDL